MYFKVSFRKWVDTDQIQLEHLAGRDFPDEVYLVEAETMAQAERIAKEYEGIETNAYEGLGSIRDVVPAELVDQNRFQLLTIYKKYLPKAARARAVQTVTALQLSRDLQNYGVQCGLSESAAEHFASDIMVMVHVKMNEYRPVG